MKKSKDLELLRKSIKHWCLDIRRPLLEGDEILSDLTWKIDGGDVEMFSDSCALCQEYDVNCDGCPLREINKTCHNKNSVYREFSKNTDIESANDMIAVLVEAYCVVMSEGG